MENKKMTFEQGPIRPPSEAASLLLRFTRNCPWNKCTFCHIYKRRTFSRRSLEEIKGDIDAVRNIIDDLHTLSLSLGCGGELSNPVLNEVFTRPSYNACYRHVAMWYAHGGANVFIQDANSLIMRTEDLCAALRYLREKLPGIQRVTSYGRSSTIARKSVEELKEIREAGLDRIHVGLESGSKAVLEFVKKGCTAQDHIDAGRKVVAAGISLSEYVMPGLGGKEWTEEHAVETAKVLNAIDPHFIRLRSTRVLPSFPLHDDFVAGRFSPLSDDDTVREIRRMVASIDGVHSTLTSDHIMNLLEEVEGAFPQDKPRMLAVMDRYLAMPPEERLLFRLGRRGGALRSLDDLNDPATRQRLQEAMQDLLAQTNGDLERLITELGDQYI
jgi:histone acetyltransferase (RNA polymerase elongator complex component)